MAFTLPARYQHKRRIDDGGMGQVHLYHDLALERDVAVKFSRRPVDLGRLLDELHALQQVRSNHVVQLYDAITDPNGPEIALVEEFLVGSDLWNYRSIRGRELLLALWQIAVGLSDIHAVRIIHRDLKPNNLKFSGQHIKLFDFGLARPHGRAAQTTGFVGTSPFAAPELYLSGAVTFTSAVDIYAFGVTAWHLVGEHFPRCLEREPPEPDSEPWSFGDTACQLTDDVIAILDRCLHRVPAERPNAREIVDLMSRHLLRDQHRALLVSSARTHRMDKDFRSLRLKSNNNVIGLHYDGLQFTVAEVSGEIKINNMALQPGSPIPGSCVIAFGADQGVNSRTFVTFDVSYPEIVL